MAGPHSKRRLPAAKPKRALSPFPLFRHQSGRWCKKVKGRHVYFGRVADDPDGAAALAQWLAERDDWLAGRNPRHKTEALTVEQLVDSFLASKKLAAETGQITKLTFVHLYRETCTRIVETFGLDSAVLDLTPADFERLRATLKDRAVTSQRTQIQWLRSVFNYAFDRGLVERPIRFGDGFRAPGERMLRKARLDARRKGSRMFSAAEIRALLAHVRPTMGAMILMGVNCGFGPSDCATLRWSDVDLDAGWVAHARPKTGAERRCPLWPETVAALRVIQRKRRPAKDPADSDRVFLTERGTLFVRMRGEDWQDVIGAALHKAMKRVGIAQRGRGFYGLRRATETVGSETKDQPAIDLVMGHLRDDMASIYRQSIDDARLRAVADHVRRWLFGDGVKG